MQEKIWSAILKSRRPEENSTAHHIRETSFNVLLVLVFNRNNVLRLLKLSNKTATYFPPPLIILLTSLYLKNELLYLWWQFWLFFKRGYKTFKNKLKTCILISEERNGCFLQGRLGPLHLDCCRYRHFRAILHCCLCSWLRWIPPRFQRVYLAGYICNLQDNHSSDLDRNQLLSNNYKKCAINLCL